MTSVTFFPLTHYVDTDPLVDWGASYCTKSNELPCSGRFDLSDNMSQVGGVCKVFMTFVSGVSTGPSSAPKDEGPVVIPGDDAWLTHYGSQITANDYITPSDRRPYPAQLFTGSDAEVAGMTVSSLALAKAEEGISMSSDLIGAVDMSDLFVRSLLLVGTYPSDHPAVGSSLSRCAQTLFKKI